MEDGRVGRDGVEGIPSNWGKGPQSRQKLESVSQFNQRVALLPISIFLFPNLTSAMFFLI